MALLPPLKRKLQINNPHWGKHFTNSVSQNQNKLSWIMASNQNGFSLEKKRLELVEEITDLQELLDRSVKELSAIQDFLEDRRETLPRLVLNVLESRESNNIEDQYGFEYQMAEYEGKLSKLQKDIDKANS